MAPPVHSTDDTALDGRLNTLRFHESCLRAALLANEGEITITHEQLGQAGLLDIAIVDVPGGVKIKLLDQ